MLLPSRSSDQPAVHMIRLWSSILFSHFTSLFVFLCLLLGTSFPTALVASKVFEPRPHLVIKSLKRIQPGELISARPFSRARDSEDRGRQSGGSSAYLPLSCDWTVSLLRFPRSPQLRRTRCLPPPLATPTSHLLLSTSPFPPPKVPRATVPSSPAPLLRALTPSTPSPTTLPSLSLNLKMFMRLR